MKLHELFAATPRANHKNIVTVPGKVLVLGDSGEIKVEYACDENNNLYLIEDHEADKIETAALKAKIDAIEAKLNTLTTKA